uniref:large ribosomal subunit protein uL30m isoform X1 n=1 Tax=Pristiophorus japonicus TaxID=55135 RepID=UPI00398EAAF5
MAVLCRNVNRLTNLMEQFLIPLSWPGFIRLKFTKARIPEKMFEVEPSDHEKYSGDPDQPHQLHIITRIKCTKRRPYWEKKIVHDLGLDKVELLLSGTLWTWPLPDKRFCWTTGGQRAQSWCGPSPASRRGNSRPKVGTAPAQQICAAPVGPKSGWKSAAFCACTPSRRNDAVVVPDKSPG